MTLGGLPRTAAHVALLLAAWGLAALVLLSAGVASAGAEVQLPCDTSTGGGGSDYSVVSAKPRYQPMPQQVVDLRSKVDGANIQIGLIRPHVPAGVKVPVVVDAGPYYNPLQTLNLAKCRPFLVQNFVPQGFAVALVPVRGTADNGGCMDLFGPDERADLNQAITWLGTQPWSNGGVGMTGLSYDGSTPWEVASFGNPHVKTIVPEEGVPNIFNLLFGGGTPDWRGPAVLNDVYYEESVLSYIYGRGLAQTVQLVDCPEYASGTAAALWSTRTGTEDPFGFWAARDYLDRVLSRYRGSVFLIQGLIDWNVNPAQQYPLVTELEHQGIYVKQLLGQWDHNYPDAVAAPAQRTDLANILLRWLDYWLKGEHQVSLGPTVELEDSTGRWRTAPQWPPTNPTTTFWLTSAGSLTTTPATQRGSEVLAPDPAHTQDPAEVQSMGSSATVNLLHAVCGQSTCAQFSTGAFGQPFRFSGIPRARLTLIPSGPSGEVSAYLYDAGPAGLTQVGWGQVDLRFPDGGRTPHSVVAGQTTIVALPIQPLDVIVAAGHRLVLMLSEGNTYNRLPSTPNYPATLEVGGEQSGLLLQPVNPSSYEFFTPPQLPERCCQ
jgi:putative CocE/NonD family hydrolase